MVHYHEPTDPEPCKLFQIITTIVERNSSAAASQEGRMTVVALHNWLAIAFN